MAAQEVEPGVFSAVFTRVREAGVNNARVALEPLVLVIEKQAKINATTGAHKYGTPTPAMAGTGPAVISGNLRRSITHDPITKTADGWETRVGTGGGFYPPYPYKSRGGGPPKRTPANRYGYYLETGLRNGTTFPFLKPAAEFGARTAAPIIYTAMYGADWTRVT